MTRRVNLFDEAFSPFRVFDEFFPGAFGRGPVRTLPAGRLLPLSVACSSTAPAASRASEVYPPMECFKRDDRLVLRAELPGVAPEDVDVSVADGRLTLKGEKKAERETKDSDIYFREMYRGRFERSFDLPEGTRAEDVEARFTNGVLEVSLPAKAAEAESRKVPIKLSS